MENAYLEDFDIALKIDGVEYLIGAKVTNRGTITVNVEEDWYTDPPEQPPVSAGYLMTDYEIEEMPEWEVLWIWVYENGNKEPTEIEGEKVNDYFILNPEKKKLIDQYIESKLNGYAEGAANEMQSDFAFDVSINEPGDYYDGPETYWERDN
jgi:hypothetical protein